MVEEIKNYLKQIFLENGLRKLASFCAAIVFWLLVNHSITIEKTFFNVPVRIVNIPQDKTIEGMLPNQILIRKVNLTLSGKKSTLGNFHEADLEVKIDVSEKEGSWISEIGKRNLVSLDPDVDIRSGISSITHTNFLIKMTPLVTATIPVIVGRPRGEPPSGYQYLDVWPQYLEHQVTGPKEEVEALREEGIELTLNLTKIQDEDLQSLPPSEFALHEDEVSFPVPQQWTKVFIPFQQGRTENINDPAAKTLHIDFLKKTLLPLEKSLPVRVYYSPDSSSKVNPQTHPLAPNEAIQEKNSLYYLSQQVHMRNVSRLFLDVVKNNMELTIKSIDGTNPSRLTWSIEYINPLQLENQYLEFLKISPKEDSQLSPMQRQHLLRSRFREYMRLGRLYDENDNPIELDVSLHSSSIKVNFTKPIIPGVRK